MDDWIMVFFGIFVGSVIMGAIVLFLIPSDQEILEANGCTESTIERRLSNLDIRIRELDAHMIGVDAQLRNLRGELP